VVAEYFNDWQMSKNSDRPVWIFLALAVAGLGSITALGILTAHPKREQMLLVMLLTISGAALTAIGSLGLFVIALKRFFGTKMRK
jgi:hypothetical protein